MPISVPSFISDNMVIQRGMPAPVWGWAEPGETITVSLADQTVICQADGDGKWTVKLGPMQAGGPYELTIIGTDATMRMKNVAVGEVWLASGQSNMQWVVADCGRAQENIAASEYPMIREFTAERINHSKPQENLNGQWQVAGPDTTGQFSAIAYYFARHLEAELGVPVGILNSSMGGSMCRPWVRREDLQADPDFAPYLENVAEAIDAYPAVQEEYEQILAEYGVAYEAAVAARRTLPEPPEAPPGYPIGAATGLYNAMIHPLIPFAIRGAIWYQGESEAVLNLAGTYRSLFSTMISGWREAWQQGDFPFLFVQLANFDGEGNWPLLRDAQLQTLSLPNTGMAVTIDVGEADDIHPKNKQAVGQRLGLGARALAYGQDAIYSGPLCKAMSIAGNKVRLAFDHVGDALLTRRNEALVGFVVAGDDEIFMEAEAHIDGEEVVVSSRQVPQPVAVRYAWENNPDCNLHNVEGLPASPFRTDDWDPEE